MRFHFIAGFAVNFFVKLIELQFFKIFITNTVFLKLETANKHINPPKNEYLPPLKPSFIGHICNEIMTDFTLTNQKITYEKKQT